ncbi:DNA-3-methyladenine glycosylase [Geomicrobium sp. JCM 19039]|uniref:DNA-3-methyladenine glycosylase family protein n=1 Tax=Geomicrobium sp. JCM 19039 TaxID=1460636 RepID=UPI00045F1DCF|nr:DNA-3-methyladenine glycosylase [Geomicrobium sp. JCM 19039]GAK14716.1 DNA-3-methyladenine glycosylase II [Geomicrobium sp. JCM 19039]
MKHFSFTANIDYLRRNDEEITHLITANRVIKALEIAGQKQVIEIHEAGDGGLAIEGCQGDKHEVQTFIDDWFDLSTDLTPFYEMAAVDRLLAGPAERFYGLRLMGIPDLFEALSWAIIGQQIHLNFAYTIKKRIVETYGEHVGFGAHTLYLFPKPERIAACTPEELVRLQLSRRKSEYLINVARLIADGQLQKAELIKDLPKAHHTLTSIRGIGPWTANYVRMRCLRDPDAFPIDDVGFQNAVRIALQRQEKPSKEELHVLARHWEGFTAYAVFYLWRLLY